jgi:metallo-beta-lactamase class B
VLWLPLNKAQGAQLMVDEKDADVVASGGSSDYELGHYGTSFKPVKPDRLLHDGDTIRLGDMQLVMLHHPVIQKVPAVFCLL